MRIGVKTISDGVRPSSGAATRHCESHWRNWERWRVVQCCGRGRPHSESRLFRQVLRRCDRKRRLNANGRSAAGSSSTSRSTMEEEAHGCFSTPCLLPCYCGWSSTQPRSVNIRDRPRACLQTRFTGLSTGGAIDGSRGTDGEVGKPRRGERKTLVKRTFCRPSGAWNSLPQTHGSRRGLSSAAATQLIQILKTRPSHTRSETGTPVTRLYSPALTRRCRRDSNW